MGVDYLATRAVPRLELGEAAMEYIQQQDEFIGAQVLPIFPTKKKAAIFPAITRESITREADTKRAPRGNYNRDGFQAKTGSTAVRSTALRGLWMTAKEVFTQLISTLSLPRCRLLPAGYCRRRNGV